ncbi:MAG: DUF3237 domain-containing protein [Halieaceae bacterium]|jgi:hypothetical protein|nr:DUF3237 domain-containing protein [Halieaceae bacterium]
MAKLELKPLATMTAQLGEQIDLGAGPRGHRVVIDVPAVKLEAEDFSAELATNDAADWATLSEEGTLAALDVRVTLKTDDGALIYVEYGGRMDMTTGFLTTAPTFQTSAERYLWLNRVQAVAAGEINPDTGELVYTMYEARPVAD